MVQIKLDTTKKCRITNFIELNKNSLPDYGIEVVADSDPDYDLFLAPFRTFDFRGSNTVEESRAKALEALEQLDDRLVILDDNDNPSLFGYKHLLKHKKIRGVLKNYLLSREDYKTPTVFGGIRHFIDEEHPSFVSFEFEDEEWSKLYLSGIDIGHYQQQWYFENRFSPSVELMDKKKIDICALYQGHHPGRKFYNQEIGFYYSKHRVETWLELLQRRRNIVMGHLNVPISNELLRASKLAISPYGMGSFCYRDFEAIFHLSVVLKPDVSHIRTLVNFFQPFETYIPYKHDLSDLNEKIDLVLSDTHLRKTIASNTYNRYMDAYDFNRPLSHISEVLHNLNNNSI